MNAYLGKYTYVFLSILELPAYLGSTYLASMNPPNMPIKRTKLCHYGVLYGIIIIIIIIILIYRPLLEYRGSILDV